MSSRFTEKAQNVLNISLQIASEMGHTYIGSEHLLAALLRAKSIPTGFCYQKLNIGDETE